MNYNTWIGASQYKSVKSPFLRKLCFAFDKLFLPQVWHLRKSIRSFSGWKRRDLRILDVDARLGHFSYWMCRKNPSWGITAISPDKELVTSGNKFFQNIGEDKVEFQQGNKEHFIQPLTYDLVLCSHLIEGNSQELKVFKNFYTSMKAEAILIISKIASNEKLETESDWDTEKQIEFIKERLSLAGFRKVDVRLQYGPAGRIAWTLSKLIPKKLLDKSKLIYILLPLYFFIVAPLCFILNWVDSHLKNKRGSGLIGKAWK